MAKTITIPTGGPDPVKVNINGQTYVYRAGQTVSVPDEVAALIEDNQGETVMRGRRAFAPLEPLKRNTDGGAVVSVGDYGELYADPIGALSAIYVDGHTLVVPSEEG